MKSAIIWFRNDLRVSDNQALHYAWRQGYALLFLYIFDPRLSIGGASRWFLHHALSALEGEVGQRYNAQLVIREGDPRQILDALVAEYAIQSLVWNRVYEPLAIARDSAIKQHFRQKGIEVKSFNSSLLFEPHTLKNREGGYFKVFTPFWRACRAAVDHTPAPFPVPDAVRAVELHPAASLALSDLALLPTKPNWAAHWDALYSVSEGRARAIAEEFMRTKMAAYKEARDFPAQRSTSRLSAYLHFGLIGPRQIYALLQNFERDVGWEHFLSEVGWREFSYYLLYHFPELPAKNFKARFDHFPWENERAALRRWQKGMTGFPLVDAGMRELWHTGWMHNRVRMVVGSFLTKNLLIDWRIGQEWFWDCLVDADLASNSASWQWVFGSGADAAPYFRIFNPILQSKKFDPEGEYIRRWVPEIAHLPNKEIHFPAARDNYPPPIIDLQYSRKRALDIYARLP